jgi:hypothetical protein
MGESPSARTQRELAELRGSIDRDVDAVVARAKTDLDPSTLMQRRPRAVVGAVGSVGALAAAAIITRVRSARKRVPDTDIERIIENLGGRVDRLKGRARKRFREQLRAEISEVQKPKRTLGEAVWGVGLAALTAGATELARRTAGRFAADDVAPTPTERPPS